MPEKEIEQCMGCGYETKDIDISNDIHICGWIYIVQTSESESKSIFRIGKTINVNKVGSKVLATIPVSNRHLAKNKLKKIFKEKFVQARQYGTEYFEGCFRENDKSFL